MDYWKSKTTLRKITPNLHLKISLGIIRFMGTWPPQDKKYFRFIYLIYTFSFFTFMLGIHLFVEVVNVFLSSGDLARIASGAPIFMTNSVHAYKFFVIVYYQKRIEKLLRVVDGHMFSKNNFKHERIVTWYSWQGIFHHMAYQSFGAFAVLCWGCIPLSALLNEKNKRLLPLDGWYPYDATKSPAFEITWAHQAIGIILGCVHNVAMDAFITGLMNVASCQFELLKWNIVAIGNDEINVSNFPNKLLRSQKYTQKIYDDRNYEELRKCVDHNLAIFDFVEEIQDMFSIVISMQLFVNCCIICLNAFYISQLTTYVTAQLMGNISYTCCMTYQIFIYCWNGNELYLQNQNFALAIYMGDWWKLSKRCKHALHIIMLRSCKPLVMTAGFFMNLSVSTFMAIIQMSYSLFTILRSRSASEV